MYARPGKTAMKSILVAASAALLGVASSQSASADPAPGFEFDPAKLEAQMDACMEYRVGEQEILMGWIKRKERRRPAVAVQLSAAHAARYRRSACARPVRQHT